jgi:hypothetical protein
MISTVLLRYVADSGQVSAPVGHVSHMGDFCASGTCVARRIQIDYTATGREPGIRPYLMRCAKSCWQLTRYGQRLGASGCVDVDLSGVY